MHSALCTRFGSFPTFAESQCSHMSFGVYLDLRSLSTFLSPSSSDKHAQVVTVHCHTHILVRSVKQSCTVYASSKSSELSTDQGHVVMLPDVRRIFSSVHALDQSSNFLFTIFLTIFCWKTDGNESLGYFLELCSADVEVSQLQWIPIARPTHRHHD